MTKLDEKIAFAQLADEMPTVTWDIDVCANGPMAQRVNARIGHSAATGPTAVRRRFMPVIASLATTAAVTVALLVAAGSTTAVRDQLTPTQARAAAISSLRGTDLTRYRIVTTTTYRELEGSKRVRIDTTDEDVDGDNVYYSQSQVQRGFEEQVDNRSDETAMLIVDSSRYNKTVGNVADQFSTGWYRNAFELDASTSISLPHTPSAGENTFDGGVIADLLQQLGGDTSVSKDNRTTITISGSVRELRAVGTNSTSDPVGILFDPIELAAATAIGWDPNAKIEAGFEFDQNQRLSKVTIESEYAAELAGAFPYQARQARDYPLSRLSIESTISYPKTALVAPNPADVSIVSPMSIDEETGAITYEVLGLSSELDRRLIDEHVHKNQNRRDIIRDWWMRNPPPIIQDTPQEMRLAGEVKRRLDKLTRQELAQTRGCSPVNPTTLRVYRSSIDVPPPNQTGWYCLIDGVEYKRAADGKFTYALPAPKSLREHVDS